MRAGTNSQGTAFITGASSGIGKAFARKLAERGFDLCVTARRAARLEALAQELRACFQSSVETLPADLADPQDLANLVRRVSQEEGLRILVNNAGFGVSGQYVEQSIDRHQRMIDVHITAAVRLTHAALPSMLQQQSGYIINVSSIAAFVPVLGGPGYCASKAYLNSFSTNLQSFVSQRGISVQALCPGYTYTEFHSSEDYRGNERETLPEWVWMTPDEVVDYSLNRLGSGKVIVIPGLKNRLISFFLRSSVGRILMSKRDWLKKHGKDESRV